MWVCVRVGVVVSGGVCFVYDACFCFLLFQAVMQATSSLNFFQSIPGHVHNDICRFATIRTYPTGHVIFNDYGKQNVSALPSHFYVVLRGEIEWTSEGTDARGGPVTNVECITEGNHVVSCGNGKVVNSEECVCIVITRHDWERANGELDEEEAVKSVGGGTLARQGSRVSDASRTSSARGGVPSGTFMTEVDLSEGEAELAEVKRRSRSLPPSGRVTPQSSFNPLQREYDLEGTTCV